MKLYQDCSWPLKLWRRRYQFWVPFWALEIWWHRTANDFTWGDCWSIAVGLSHVKMNWVYTWDEVKQQFNNW